MSLVITRFLLLGLMTFSACSQEDDGDYPSRNQAPFADEKGQSASADDLEDPMSNPDARHPDGPLTPLPGYEDEYNGGTTAPNTPYGDWTNPTGDDGYYQSPDNANGQFPGDNYNQYPNNDLTQNPQDPNYYYPGNPVPDNGQTHAPVDGGAPAPNGPYGPAVDGPVSNVPFFVVLGGYKSCRLPFIGAAAPNESLFSAFTDYRIGLEKASGRPVQYIMTCYNYKDPGIQYITSANPGEIRPAAETDLVGVIESMVGPNTPISMIGHSMGGWLAMKTVVALNGRNPIQNLFTLDAISAAQCNMPMMPGCRRAPQDFSHSELQLIVDTSLKWVNVYERITPALMSDKISFADINQNVFVTHTHMDTSPKVWAIINQEMVY